MDNNNPLSPSLETPTTPPVIQTYLKEVEVNGQKVWKTYAKLSDLKPDPNNPRDITEEKAGDLVYFLEKYGQLSPMLVDFRSLSMGNLIGGNKRYEAEQKRGTQEVWIEPRVPQSDSDAFTMGTVDNMAFGHYIEEKLKAEVLKHEDEMGKEIKRLEAHLKDPVTLAEVLKEKSAPKSKWEIIIRCHDENEFRDRYEKIASLGIPVKAK